jgi:tRNA-Thr(GGU) m(6)t(6)A37 methyltransferase TsaA
MSDTPDYCLQPIGFIQSTITTRQEAPKQGYEGAPDAWIIIDEKALPAMEGLTTGDDIILITWFHKSKRDVLQIHPRGDINNPITGVFATRSPDRPNPLGLHRVKVLEIKDNKLKVGPLEALDGTPVVDIKPVLPASQDA